MKSVILCFQIFVLISTKNYFFVSSSIVGTQIRWEAASHSELFFLDLEPAGIEIGTHLLLCRANPKGSYWVTGKIFTGNKYFSCNIADGGKGFEFSEFQVLLKTSSKSQKDFNIRFYNAFKPNY